MILVKNWQTQTAIYNMRTAQYWSAPKQKEKAREYHGYYAPDSTASWYFLKIKIELDDLSFKISENRKCFMFLWKKIIFEKENGRPLCCLLWMKVKTTAWDRG